MSTFFEDSIEIKRPWSDWIFLRQQRDMDGNGGFHIHNPWGNSNQPQGDASRNRLEFGYRTPPAKICGGNWSFTGLPVTLESARSRRAPNST